MRHFRHEASHLSDVCFICDIAGKLRNGTWAGKPSPIGYNTPRQPRLLRTAGVIGRKVRSTPGVANRNRSRATPGRRWPMPQPKISILIATFNASRHLAGCLENIRRQTYPHREVIVADGGSTDSTL